MWYFGALAVCGVVGAAGYWVRLRSPRLGIGLMTLATAGFLGALAWQVFHSTVGNTPRAIDRHSAAVAYFLGYAVAGDVAARPGPVAILLPGETRGNRTTLDSWFDTVARVLSPIPGVEIKEVPVPANAHEIERGEVPPAVFARALETVSNSVAWISFVGVPREFGAGANSGAPTAAHGYVYDPSAGIAWVSALKAGRIQRVVVPRPPPEAGETRPRSGPPDEIFRAHFVMVTAANADQVAAQLGARPAR